MPIPLVPTNPNPTKKIIITSDEYKELIDRDNLLVNTCSQIMVLFVEKAGVSSIKLDKDNDFRTRLKQIIMNVMDVCNKTN